MKKIILFALMSISLLYAKSTEDGVDNKDLYKNPISSSIDNIMNEFENEKSETVSVDNYMSKESRYIPRGFTGKVTQQAIYSYNGISPHDGWSSLRTSLFLDYEHKFENGWKFKINVRAFHDWIYDLKDKRYTFDELDQLRSEIELFDAYIEGSISNTLDFKVGRQVVVWGRSDTIRITDVLNPIDNRRPGLVDIEYLRLPVAMLKMDYYIGDWRVTPIAILEQRFTKDPPYGSQFNPAPFPLLNEEDYNDITYALSVGGEFSGWDINFYAAHIYDDTKLIQDPLNLNALAKHKKINMFGTAFNVLNGSWLFKTEFAYFNKLEYTLVPQKEFKRIDGLLGVEYHGIADTVISYDISDRYFIEYDQRLGEEYIFTPVGKQINLFPINRNTWQHALRISSDFMNASLHANYLVSLFGKSGDEGGFQRVWIEYEINDMINSTIGIVDYIGGSQLFDSVSDADMVFAEISYSF